MNFHYYFCKILAVKYFRTALSSFPLAVVNQPRNAGSELSI